MQTTMLQARQVDAQPNFVEVIETVEVVLEQIYMFYSILTRQR